MNKARFFKVLASGFVGMALVVIGAYLSGMELKRGGSLVSVYILSIYAFAVFSAITDLSTKKD